MKQKEFIATVLPFKDKLYRLAKRILVSGDEAEDAVQEVYLKLWKGRNKISNYKNPEAFAVTMTKNYCLDRLKSKQASNLKIVHNNFQTSENVELSAFHRSRFVFCLCEVAETWSRINVNL